MRAGGLPIALQPPSGHPADPRLRSQPAGTATTTPTPTAKLQLQLELFEARQHRAALAKEVAALRADNARLARDARQLRVEAEASHQRNLSLYRELARVAELLRVL